MIIRFHKNFEKQYKKLSSKTKKQTQKKLELFCIDPYSTTLNNHPLKGKYVDYRSINPAPFRQKIPSKKRFNEDIAPTTLSKRCGINISGDIRAIYKFNGSKECIFAAIGSHGELYS